MPKARKIIIAVVLIFVVYAVINSPEQSADVVKQAFDQIVRGLQAIGTFFDSLISG